MFGGKYGVALHIYIPIPKRAVVDFAVSADWTPAAGDVKISKDGGAAANVTNLPTAITMGNTAIWDFSITATEMQAAKIIVTVSDSATKAVEDTSFIIQTHGHASAAFVMDFSTAVPTANENAEAGLIFDWTAIVGSAASRSTLNALRFLRNKWALSGGTLTVKKEDDSTTAWTGATDTDAAAEPIIGLDPS